MDKERQYTALYFRGEKLDEKDEVYNALLDIDANFSKIIEKLLPSLLVEAKKIIAAGKNFRHYNWKVVIEERPKEKVHGKDSARDPDVATW